MSRLTRKEVVDPTKVQIFHVLNRTVRRCWLFGTDPLTGVDYNHRKGWIEDRLQHFAAYFGIDLLAFAILSSHYHLMLRSRPDLVATWDDTEVARRWLMICPKRKHKDGSPRQPNKRELDEIRNNQHRLKEIRLRLSDISWWMRLLDQRIARRCNDEDKSKGRFFEDRFKAIPLIDEEAITACAVYIDLNVIRASIAETIELSDHTSGQLRLRAFQAQSRSALAKLLQCSESETGPADVEDSFLSPISLLSEDQREGVMASRTGRRGSDKGFLPMTEAAYLELLDWTARQTVAGKCGRTPEKQPPILQRLGVPETAWLKLVTHFGRLFPTMAGLPRHVAEARSLKQKRRFYLPDETRQLLQPCG